MIFCALMPALCEDIEGIVAAINEARALGIPEDKLREVTLLAF